MRTCKALARSEDNLLWICSPTKDLGGLETFFMPSETWLFDKTLVD